MKVKIYLNIFLIGWLIISCNNPNNIDEDQTIKPYSNNNRYWQYKSEPVLLLGGTKDDNLFQIPELREHLDSLKVIGGNYIRNVMSSRKISGFEVQPFVRLTNDTYDLNQWNVEYWNRFQDLTKQSSMRRYDLIQCSRIRVLSPKT